MRPLTPDEIDHLEALKAGLDSALNGALVTGGIAALPLLFLGATLRSGGGLGQDPVALVMSVVILAGLTGAVIGLGGSRGGVFRAGDWRLRSLIAQDLVGRRARTVSGEVTARHEEATRPWWARRGRAGAPRRFWLELAGERFEVSASRYLATPVGMPMALTVAERSAIVLGVDGVRDRLPPPPRPSDAQKADIIGLPVRRDR